MVRCALLCVALGGVWAALPVHAQPAPADAYQTFIDDAVREFSAGNFVEARTLFEQAHARRPSARTLRALGVCAFELKHYMLASEEFAAALADERMALTPQLAKDVKTMLEKARQFVGELRLEIQPANSRIVIDGQPRTGRRFELDAGDHLVLASAPGYRNLDLSVSIVGMQTRIAELTLTPLSVGGSAESALALDRGKEPAANDGNPNERSPALTERWWFWAMIGILAVGVAASAVVVASSDDNPARGSSGVTLHAM